MPLPNFITPWALLGFLLLIPIIVLYLLKPKPRHIKLPTVMFIMGMEKPKRFQSFFKRFVRDPLLLTQILIVSLLVLAMANPFLIAQEKQNVKEAVVFIVDGSASMQSTDVSPSRFERSREILQGLIDDLNYESSVSIILAENIPILILKNSDKETAKEILYSLKCGDTPTNIGDSMLFAKDLLSGVAINKKIYVLSDFSKSQGMDVQLAKKISAIDNITVNFVKVSGKGRNSGIININAKRFVTNSRKFFLTFTVRNFNRGEEEVTVDIVVDDKVIRSEFRNIPALSDELFHFEGDISEEPQTIIIRLKNKDDFMLDNTAFVFLPGVEKHKVLLITDDNSDLYLRYALESSPDIELKRAIPPIIPELNEFDVVILGELNKDLLLPGTFADILSYVQDGGCLVILATTNLNEFQNSNLDALLPVWIDRLIESNSEINVELDHEILEDVVPKNAEKFPNIVVKKYFRNTAKNKSVVIATVMDSAVIAYHPIGKGKSAYIGINPNPEWSNFYYSSTNPIFWLQLINWITREEGSLGITSFKTGDYLPLSENVKIKTPSGRTIATKDLMLDEVGIYEIDYSNGKNKIAVNLVDEDESDITHSLKNLKTINDENFNIRTELVDVKKEFYLYLLVIVILFLLVEVYYYRQRGLL